MGSKNRIAKDILPIILKDRTSEQWYVEPFVGGANMIDKVGGKRIGADLNPYVIEALKLIRDKPESLPEHVSEDTYRELKDNRPLNGLTGWVGFTCSFAAKWFGGFARNKKGDNYASRAKDNALKQSPFLKDVLFIHSSYAFLDVPPKSIIYCDPPYRGTTGYKDGFEHVDFWQWCRDKHAEGHKVYISEYSAPDDFVCVWEKKQKTSLGNLDSIESTEKLFIFDDLL